MSPRLLNVPIWLWLLFAGAGAVFVLFPGIDLAVAGLFHAPGGGFVLRGTWFERLFYHSVPVLMYGVGLGLLALPAARHLAGRPPGRVGPRQAAYLLLVLALGPGLIVNSLLKEHWGRARPVQVVELGGDRAFTPAFLPSDQRGGSFSSGHAAAAAWLVVVALVAARRPAPWAGAAAAYAVLVGLARVGAGGHFLSDVVVSFFIVALSALILRGSLFGTPLRRRGAVP